jgi:hypothetical protein
VRAALVVLFPETPERGTPQPRPGPPGPGHADAARSAGRRAVYVAIQAAAVCIGTVVLLLRIPRIPAWDSLYAEDQGVYLFDALAHPWRLLVPFGGYEELVPRLVGQLISYLPLADAAVPFALTGAGIAALCALFIYHAMDGWIWSPWLRALVHLLANERRNVRLVRCARCRVRDVLRDTAHRGDHDGLRCRALVSRVRH